MGPPVHVSFITKLMDLANSRGNKSVNQLRCPEIRKRSFEEKNLLREIENRAKAFVKSKRLMNFPEVKEL